MKLQLNHSHQAPELEPRESALEDRREMLLPISASRYRVALVREETIPGTPPCLKHPALAARFFWRQLEDATREELLAVFLDQRHRLIGWQQAFTGTLTRVAVEPRPILQAALLSNAHGFLLGHNHPSGDPLPSQEDLALTRWMDEAGKAIGVELLDHIIVGTRGCWTSIKRSGGW